MENSDARPAIVYIAGYGRSGSTLLDLLIGSSGEVEAVGELAHAFEGWTGVEKRCSCGRLVSDCNFWAEVKKNFLTLAGDQPSPRNLLEKQLSVESRKGLLPLLLGIRSRRLLAEYAKYQVALVSAIQKTCGKRLILDSSKSARLSAGRAYALWRVAGLQTKIIHLIRDGRGVVWSVMRGSNVRMENRQSDVGLTFPKLRAIYGWFLANLTVLLQSSFMPSRSVLRVRYEDFVRKPEAELERIGKFLHLDLSEVIEGIRSERVFTAKHSLSGNRMRHSGVKAIVEDREWEARLPQVTRVLYWVVCWPLHFIVFKRDSRKKICLWG